MAHHHHHDHVCMVEGNGYDQTALSLNYQSLQEQSSKKDKELQRLRALLESNRIPWKSEQSSTSSETTTTLTPSTRKAARFKTATTSQPMTPARILRSRKSGLVNQLSPKSLPELPLEVQYQILGYGLTSARPIIDPFFKLRKDNITKAERTSNGRSDIAIGLLGVCRGFNVEGKQILVKNNDFIFTQAAALENFARIPLDLRSTINQVTFRIVGRYYDEKPRKQKLGWYHRDVQELRMDILPRPNGTGGGLEAYCWTQVADFLKALITEPHSNPNSKLLPGLKSLRIDLVNFSHHIPWARARLTALVRLNLGELVDELMMTGTNSEYDDPDYEGSEEKLLSFLLRPEGLLIDGCAEYVSGKDCLRPLKGMGRILHVIRADDTKSKPVPHPEGGMPPKSSVAGETIWKWASEHYEAPKKWIEFDRETGERLADLIHMMSAV